jgi:pimeloyl-ACP methyl ester carboxylesterase
LLGLLDAASVPGPSVLVGHSIGGLIVDAFARRWPDQGSGMVLIDTSSAHRLGRAEAGTRRRPH